MPFSGGNSVLRLAAMGGNIEVRGEIDRASHLTYFYSFFFHLCSRSLNHIHGLQIINMLMDAAAQNVTNELSEKDCATIREEVLGLWVHGAWFLFSC